MTLKAIKPRQRRFYQSVLGCKVNRYDAELLRASLLESGYKETDKPEEADILFIHSCVVTHKAERDVRRLSNRFYRARKPGALIVLTGCLLPSISLREHVDYSGSLLEVSSLLGIELKKSTKHQRRARAVVKVQEGCGFRCSYCIVPKVRDGPRSRPLDDIVREIEELLDGGHREIVLTGTQIGDWGKEFGLNLIDLLQKVASLPHDFRVRISSLLPLHLTDEIISLLEEKNDKFVPHLHIPIQSGSQKVLKDMRRPYNISLVRSVLDKLFNEIPDISIGTDIIAGFPTEENEDFNDTVNLIKDYPFSYLHVFEYSKRPMTEAEKLSQIPRDIVKERVEKLLELGVQKRREYAERFVGRKLSCLIEHFEENTAVGTTENYLRILFERNGKEIGDIVDVIATGIIGTPTSGPPIVQGRLEIKG